MFMLCYFFSTQEIFGSVAPDVQRGVQVSGGIRETRFYGISNQSWQKEGGITLGEGARLHLAHQIKRLEGHRPRVGLWHKLA